MRPFRNDRKSCRACDSVRPTACPVVAGLLVSRWDGSWPRRGAVNAFAATGENPMNYNFTQELPRKLPPTTAKEPQSRWREKR